MKAPPSDRFFRDHGLLPPSPEAVLRLAVCLELRARWARVHDLVGPAASADPWTVDVLDALAVRAVLAPRPLSLVDVGAGAGVPGLLVACLEPDRPVELIEPRAKRVAFLRAARRTIPLDQLRVTRGRWPPEEALGAPAQVVSRAVVSAERWPAFACEGGPHVAHVIRMLGRDRPAWSRPGWVLAAALEYRADASRRVERWCPASPDATPP